MAEPCAEPHPDQSGVLCDKPQPCYGYHANAEYDLTWGHRELPGKRVRSSRIQQIVTDAVPAKRTGPPVRLEGHRDGETYEADFDYDRLNDQAKRVYLCIRDGRWWSLAEIAERTSDPEASISARLRDLRKPRFGGLRISRRARDREAGLYEYRLETARLSDRSDEPDL